jgi:hypothetical protein
MSFFSTLREIFAGRPISEDIDSLGYQVKFEYDDLSIPVLIIDEHKEQFNDKGELINIHHDTVLISAVHSWEIPIPRKWRRERLLREPTLQFNLDISTHIFSRDLEQLDNCQDLDQFLEFLIRHRRFHDVEMRLFSPDNDKLCTGEYYIFNYPEYEHPTPEEFSHNPGTLRLIEDQIMIEVPFHFSIEGFNGTSIDLYNHFLK